jgi:hypothetical protein
MRTIKLFFAFLNLGLCVFAASVRNASNIGEDINEYHLQFDVGSRVYIVKRNGNVNVSKQSESGIGIRKKT